MVHFLAFICKNMCPPTSKNYQNEGSNFYMDYQMQRTNCKGSMDLSHAKQYVWSASDFETCMAGNIKKYGP
jgi:hypothetical protein